MIIFLCKVVILLILMKSYTLPTTQNPAIIVLWYFDPLFLIPISTMTVHDTLILLSAWSSDPPILFVKNKPIEKLCVKWRLTFDTSFLNKDISTSGRRFKENMIIKKDSLLNGDERVVNSLAMRSMYCKSITNALSRCFQYLAKALPMWCKYFGNMMPTSAQRKEKREKKKARAIEKEFFFHTEEWYSY